MRTHAQNRIGRGYACRRFMRHSRRLTCQRALPYAKEQLFELGEALGPKLGAPFALDIAEYIEGLCVG
ncbi:MAG TPA: hypothetical protein VMW51_06075, partial [Terriglobia bacterium]|nr:hypothetical protein [Terriglobia bacterium]